MRISRSLLGQAWGAVMLSACLALWTAPAVAESGVRWRTDLESAQREAAATNRLVLVHLWAPWCAPCKAMDRDVFVKPEVASAIERDFVPVKLNADKCKDLSQKWKVEALPSDLVLTPSGELIAREKGYREADSYGRLLVVMAARGKASLPAQPHTEPQTSVAAAPTGQPQGGQFDERGSTVPFDPTQAMQYGSGQGPASPAGGQIATRPGSESQHDWQPSMPGGSTRAAPGQYAGGSAPSSRAPTHRAGQVEAAPQVDPGLPPVALEGFCPVSLWTTKQWIPGDRRWGAWHHNKLYLFGSEASQQQFLADPNRYAPAAAGDDLVEALDGGRSVAGRTDFACKYEGRVYLFSGEASLERFRQSPERYTVEALQARRLNPR